MSTAKAKFTSTAPIFSTTSVPRWLAFYTLLGFETHAYASGEEYGYARRDGVSLHCSRDPKHDPKTTTGCCYLYVDDAEALAAEWRGVVQGMQDKGDARVVGPSDTDYGLREGGMIDCDGNLIRFGSSINPPGDDK